MLFELGVVSLMLLSCVLAVAAWKLISHLHDVVLRRDETGNPIETRLHQLSQDLHMVITNYLQDTVESMVRSAQDKCPNVLSEEKVVDDIRAACLAKSQVSPCLVDEAIVEQGGSVILNKVNEVNLSVASTVSDRVIDEVVDSLTRTCKCLQTGEGPRKRASTGGDLSNRERGSSESSTRSERSTDTVSQCDDTNSQKSDPSPLATPQLASKRKSLHGRKLRPQSVVAESLDSVSELPSSCGQLQHLGKGRPRRVKTRAPTRPMGHAEVLEEDHDISEGVDTFFRPGSSTPTTPLVSPDSENSPRLMKYGSTSSMESFPHTGGAQTASDRGSVESLTRSDSLARSESDPTRDSPRLRNRSRDTEEEDDYEEESEEREDKSQSVSSLVGKRSGEAASKTSPDLSARKSSTSSTISVSEDKNRPLEEDGKDDSPPKKTTTGTGFQRIGMGYGGGIMAEMKARQEKRSSLYHKDEEKEKEERRESASSVGLLGGVRLRSTGLADSLKSPTNGFPRTGSGAGKSPTSNRASSVDSGASLVTSNSNSSKPLICAQKPKPPPPLAPKPRPKSAFTPERRSGEFDQVLAPEEEKLEGTSISSTPARSVRELAASLANKSPSSLAVEDAEKRKSASLPRNATPEAGGSGAGREHSGW